MNRLNDLIAYTINSTVVYRKGEVIKDEGVVNGIGIIRVDDYPEQPASRQTVDCHFVTVGFTEHAPTLSHAEFYELIAASSQGEFVDINLDRMGQGPSYIELGQWLGNQTIAFQFMALGELHGLWHVITPKMLHIPEEDWDEFAGLGLIMISGIKEPVS